MRYLVAERLKDGIVGDLGFYQSCEHRHQTEGGAKRCVRRLNGVDKRAGQPRGYWKVGERLSRGGNPPVELHRED